MQFEVWHRYLDRPPEAVWQVLFDRECLHRAIPGCRALESESDGLYRASLGLDVGPIKGRFEGSVTLSDADPPRRYRLRLEGGGAPGQVDADAWISLRPEEADTLLLCQAEVRTTGTLAAVGERLVGGIGKMLVGRFLQGVEQELSRQRAAP